MALNLQLSTLQANDNKLLQFTDTTGVYSGSNTGGWESPNLAVTAIDGSTHTLELLIRIVTPDADTTYSYINLFTLFGPFTSVSDLVFEINASHILDGSTPLGTSSDQLPDGLYYITYIVDRGLAGEVYTSFVMFVDGQVRNATYNKLRTIPTVYKCNNCKNKEIDDAILAHGYLKAMESTAYVAKTEELLNDLSVLQRIVLYGCDCSW